MTEKINIPEELRELPHYLEPGQNIYNQGIFADTLGLGMFYFQDRLQERIDSGDKAHNIESFDAISSERVFSDDPEKDEDEFMRHYRNAKPLLMVDKVKKMVPGRLGDDLIPFIINNMRKVAPEWFRYVDSMVSEGNPTRASYDYSGVESDKMLDVNEDVDRLAYAGWVVRDMEEIRGIKFKDRGNPWLGLAEELPGLATAPYTLEGKSHVRNYWAQRGQSRDQE